MKDELCNYLWSMLEYWKSENFLAKLIQNLHPSATNSRIYPAAANGSACVRQSLYYEASAQETNTSVRPLLLYYAYLNWMKAVLHITDLDYPSTTAVLQHGISVRRTKRSSYHLCGEMVYIYKQGVLPSAAKHVGIVLPHRVLLGDSLGTLIEMNPLIRGFYPKYQHLFPITAKAGEAIWLVPRSIAAANGQTTEEWMASLMETAQRSGKNIKDATDKRVAHLSQWAREAPEGYLRLPDSLVCEHPWRIQDPATGSDLFLNQSPLPDFVNHFIVLYCLSALVRYNPLEWSDILLWHNEQDALLVETYLKYVDNWIRRSVHSLLNHILLR